MNQINPNPRAVTIADLCEAINDGKLNVTTNDDYYMVKMRDLVQLSRIVNFAPVSPQPSTNVLRREHSQPLALAS